LKIGKDLTKLLPRVWWLPFFGTQCTYHSVAKCTQQPTYHSVHSDLHYSVHSNLHFIVYTVTYISQCTQWPTLQCTQQPTFHSVHSRYFSTVHKQYTGQTTIKALSSINQWLLINCHIVEHYSLARTNR